MKLVTDTEWLVQQTMTDYNYSLKKCAPSAVQITTVAGHMTTEGQTIFPSYSIVVWPSIKLLLNECK